MTGGRIAAVLAPVLLSACAAAPGQIAAPIADLSGTNWTVVAVNGRAIPPQGEYALRFDRSGGVGARFGCNSMGGQYAVAGGTLTVRDLAQTLIGCPEPSASFERDGGAILGQPMQMSFSSNERLALSNGAGTITLDPIP